MSIKFRCNACSHGIKVPDEAAGKATKCPQCGEKVRVPAAKSSGAAKQRAANPAARKKKAAEDHDSNAFLENIDFDRLADSEVQLCQKCAAEIPEGETACPECGFDPQHLTVAGRKRLKMAAQGIDPSTFYAVVWKDSFRFAFSHIGQMLKTGAILAFFFVMAAYCATFVIWVATVPPFAFWTLVTAVCVLIPIGWLQVQHLEIIKLTLAKKDQIKKMLFDFALCGMYGMKFLAWVLIFGLPFWIVFGGLGVLLNNMEIPFGMAIGLGLGAFALLLFTPQAMSHLAMPVEQPGWFFPKIIPSLEVSFLPGLVWAILFLVVNLPVIGGAVTVTLLGGEQFQEFVRISQLEAKVYQANTMLRLAEGAASEAAKQEIIDKYTDDSKLEVPAKNWSAVYLPVGGGVLCCFLLGISSVVVARANGLFTSNLRKGLDLISQAKEIVWESRQKDDGKVRTRKTTLPAPPAKRFAAYLGDSLLLAVLIALITFIAMQLVNVILETAGVDPASQMAQIILYSVISLLSLLILAFYFINMESSEDQATMVKKAMNLYVCNDELRPISTGQAVLRFVVMLFLSNGLTFGIGSLMALFREDRKTLHDLLSGTQVRMDKPQAPAKD